MMQLKRAFGRPTKRTILFVLLSLVAGSSAAQNDDRETVYWYVSHFPPAFITSGRYQGMGWGDKRIQLLMQRMPEFRHEIVEASVNRFVEDVATKPNVCRTTLLKTPERETLVSFTAPISWTLPNGIITTRARLARLEPYMNKRNEVRLGALLDAGNYRVGVIAVRSFGNGIDAVLRKHAGQPTVVTVPSSDQSSSRLLKLIHQDEFDAIVGYAVELRYLTRELGLNETDFVFVPVAEESRLVPTFVGCSKSPLGQRIVDHVNRALHDRELLRADAAAYRYWLDDASNARFERARRELVEYPK